MRQKPTFSQIVERLIYLLAVVLTPGIPLFFLYSRNAAQGLLFRHFLIMGGVLALISLVIYLLVSKFFLKRRRAMVIIALFWSAFWFFTPLGKIITRGNAWFPQERIAAYLLILIVIIAFIFRFINMNRLVANTIAVLLCLMFAFNFIPQALAVSAGEMQRAKNEITGELPYKIKTEFNVDPDLPKPNIYWFHMDGMMGFDAVERYFNDPQTALKNDLAECGFVINKSARLEAGGTRIAVPAMTSPVFYDSYLGGELARVAQFTRTRREMSLKTVMTAKGFSFADVYPQIEILKAFSDAGYINIGNFNSWNIINQSNNLNIWLVDNNVTTGVNIYREADSTFNILIQFKELIIDASALSMFKPKIDEMVEKKRPVLNTQPLPAYQEVVDKYITGSDFGSIVWYDVRSGMADVVRAMMYVTSIQNPHFVYFNNMTAHASFILDENGNFYKEPLEDPNDFHLYLPQHKYAVKQMIAQIDIIIENDPDAVIIVQADHGIHTTSSFESLYAYGYDLEDQLNLNFSVISAVRIPPQYGKLSQPLDPLDIARYLVNNFVGKGNYDYLYYTEEGSK